MAGEAKVYVIQNPRIETVEPIGDELSRAVEAMANSFHVRLIATFEPELASVPTDADATRWLAANHPEFDQFPVKEGGATVGLLLRSGAREGETAGEAMEAIRDGLVVSADMPIADLIPQLGGSHSRLVVRGTRIDGLVTRSDLLKLPVRMLVFGLVTHLELRLRDLIRNRVGFPFWLERLSERRRCEVERSIRRIQDARLDPDPLEFTMFNDVVRIAAQEPELGDQFGRAAEPLRKLRNDVAHAREFIGSVEAVQEFADSFASLQHWIARVSGVIKAG